MKHTHVVQVHSLENGEPNFSNVIRAFEYDTMESAYNLIRYWNRSAVFTIAVYVGCSDDEIGEMV